MIPTGNKRKKKENIYFIMIPTGNKRKKNGSGRNREETFHPSSTPFYPTLLCQFERY